MEPSNLKSVLESILFVSSKPLSIKEFSKLTETEPELVSRMLSELVNERQNSGVVVLENSGYYQLATNAQNADQVKDFLNTALREKLTDATVEVLAIIAYRQPISKAEIEAIRGVNSQYSLRHLLMRGMIEKISNPSDARGFLYQTTTEFLMHLGLTSTVELPSFEQLVKAIKLPETPIIVTETAAEESSEKLPDESKADEPTENQEITTTSDIIITTQSKPAEPSTTEIQITTSPQKIIINTYTTPVEPINTKTETALVEPIKKVAEDDEEDEDDDEDDKE